MTTNQLQFSFSDNVSETSIEFTNNPQLILAFGAVEFFEKPELFNVLSKRYPDAILMACSTAGEIYSNEVTDNQLIINAIEFEKTSVSDQVVEVESLEKSYEAGLKLGRNLPKKDLKHVIVLSTALVVNGDELLEGIREGLPADVKVTGGLAGDGDRFGTTYVLGDHNSPSKTAVKAVGFYGDIEITYSSTGGWEETEARYRVTKSNKNVLYKINNKPALQVYKEYLGPEKSKELPAIGLEHPFNMLTDEFETPVVRTILGIDEDEQSLIFAGDIFEGSTLKIMKASVDLIIEGARESATVCLNGQEEAKNVELTVIVSCVGRKLFLGDFVTEEVEKVIDEIGDSSVYTGFYSYGEISPFQQDGESRLHNQTMTVTTFSEHINKPISQQKQSIVVEPEKGVFRRLFGL